MKELLDWYHVNKRELPWRNTHDPYKIWLSEIILQQTRVKQGLDYYLKFVDKYPDIDTLAAAGERDVLKLWQGLGYYSRARNLLITAKELKRKYKSKFPADYQSILSLKGIGDYTAAAISSLAFGLPYPVIDGNVKRVYSRFAGMRADINSRKGNKKLNKISWRMLDKNKPGEYNSAVMELGALCCLPRNPLCDECPLKLTCHAYKHGLTGKLPVKKKKAKQKIRYLTYVVLEKQGKIMIRLRKNNDIWKGLYDFPSIENDNKQNSKFPGTEKKELINIFNIRKFNIESVSDEYEHTLSHRKLKAKFVRLRLNEPLRKAPSDCLWIDREKIYNYPVPRLIEKYIKEL